jgi:hypothetical protein
VRLDNTPDISPKYYHRESCAYIKGGKRAPAPPDPDSRDAGSTEPLEKA